MALIGTSSKADNNAAVRTSAASKATAVKPSARTSALVKKQPEEPAKQPKTTKTTSAKPNNHAETSTVARQRKDIKTPPSSAGSSKSASSNQTEAAKPASSDKLVKAHPLPSTTLHKHKQAAVWTTGKKKHKTNFGAAYDAGAIPCRINHGGIKNALQWTKEPSALDFNPLLITCVEGFQETEHPFVFLARTAFRELMAQEDARDKTVPILPQLITPLRMALMAKEEDIFLMALEATRLLSDVVDVEMNTYLPKLTQQIHRKLLTKQLRTQVEDTLATLERNGGKEALAIIRSKIPTYTSVNF